MQQHLLWAGILWVNVSSVLTGVGGSDDSSTRLKSDDTNPLARGGRDCSHYPMAPVHLLTACTLVLIRDATAYSAHKTDLFTDDETVHPLQPAAVQEDRRLSIPRPQLWPKLGAIRGWAFAYNFTNTTLYSPGSYGQ